MCLGSALVLMFAPPGAYADSPPERLDLSHQRAAMLMGSAWRGQPGGHGWYFRDYGIDNLTAFEQVIARDGFNCFDFTLNRGNGEPELFADRGRWDAFAQGLTRASHSGMTPVVELLVAGYADTEAARRHPEWQVVQGGKPWSHMGPWLCVNSPFFGGTLLPRYRDFFANAGRHTAALILWENQGPDCRCDFCQKEFAAQKEVRDYRRWARQSRLRAWRAIRDTVRATGWKGTIIGGGYGSYEWEEKRWDQTLTVRDELGYNFNELEAFTTGVFDLVMPELYTHNTFPAGNYRREDIHYVYRSLLYERSVFGRQILPNVELYWDGRSMTPDELCRWLLESRSAGYDSYSVVSEGKLYTEHFHPTQDQYRSAYREMFRAFNSLAGFGTPEVRFQFVVSQDLERALYRRSPKDWDWYVRETNHLFKTLDRRFGGGAIVNERVTELPLDELRGVTDTSLSQFVIVPRGMPSPRTDAPRVKRLEVELGQSLAPLAEELNGFLVSCARPCVLEKSPLVYVNFNRTPSEQRFCSVINHGTTPGTVRVRTAGAQWQCVLDSSHLSGRSVRLRQAKDTLELDLDPGAAAALSVKETFQRP